MANKDAPHLNWSHTVFLVVDDIEAMRKVISYQLRTLGAAHILTANNGAEALKVLRQHPVDVILSDWNMPVLSGLELLKTLRADDTLYRVPFVMITAEAERARVEEAIAHGVSNLLVKPYTTSSLADRIEKAKQSLPKRASATATAAALGNLRAHDARRVAPSVKPVQAPVERPTILVVDDTPDNLQLLSELLMDDYRVRVADSGQKALDICCSDTPPDLVLLDVMMPGMDGFEVARRMREHPSAETIPVIFVTALTTPDAHIKGLELGAVDFVTKPIDPERLKHRVRNFMRYVALRKQLQADYDAMLLLSQLHEDVELITRHDVKAPLAGIMALVQPMLEEPGLNADQLERLRLIEDMALQALNVVNLTTELYKIETGRFELKAQPVAIGDIVRRVVELARGTFAVKNLELALDAGPPAIAPLQVQGDTVFCYSILQNLLKNACEAAPEGSTVEIGLKGSDPVAISIRNTGAVPVAIRERFFDKYVTSGKEGGTGLGTYSAKLLTEAQGGSIRLEVQDGENRTEVTVLLPRGTSASVASSG
jgi:two-component system sensor histidine kinase/response regulator